MSSERFYVFEYGSGSTWGRYIAPASHYRVWVDAEQQLCMGSVVPSSVWMKGINKETFQVVGVDFLALGFSAEFLEGKGETK